MRFPSFTEKLVLVTGAASGIGYEIAQAFTKTGGRVIVTDIREAEAYDAPRRLGALAAYRLDISDPESVDTVISDIIAAHGVPDILINNAGIYYIGGFVETPLEVWHRMHNVNQMGIVHMCRALIEPMKSATGPRAIANIASLSSFLAAPNLAAYAASKHAVLGLGEVLMIELSDSNIAVTTICPGIINTPLLAGKNRASNITDRQLKTQKDYYARHGCAPQVVAKAMVDAIARGDDYAFPGPNAKSGYMMTRISRRMARQVSLKSAPINGYEYAPTTGESA